MTTDLSEEQRTKSEAGAFRRLVAHLRERTDVQNIDLMNLAGFCRNCLSKWYRAAAEEQGATVSDATARETVYGEPYEAWKAKHQREAGAKDRAEQLVQDYFDRWNAHDGPGVEALFAPDGTYEDVSTGGVVPRAKIAAEVADVAGMFEGMHFVSHSWTRQGNVFVVEWTMSGKNAVPYRDGVVATGKEVTLHGIDIIEVSDRGLERVKGYFDRFNFVESFGLRVKLEVAG